jgi:hypothetical protein
MAGLVPAMMRKSHRCGSFIQGGPPAGGQLAGEDLTPRVRRQY